MLFENGIQRLEEFTLPEPSAFVGVDTIGIIAALLIGWAYTHSQKGK